LLVNTRQEMNRVIRRCAVGAEETSSDDLAACDQGASHFSRRTQHRELREPLRFMLTKERSCSVRPPTDQLCADPAVKTCRRLRAGAGRVLKKISIVIDYADVSIPTPPRRTNMANPRPHPSVQKVNDCAGAARTNVARTDPVFAETIKRRLHHPGQLLYLA
jgi:hypothetical protein